MNSAHLDRTLTALADPTRRGIVDLLRRKPLWPSEIAEKLSVSRPEMSRHLRVLRQAGLVSDEIHVGDARVRMYQLCPRPFVELQGWLDQVAGFWGDQLQSFKRYAEHKGSKVRS